MTQSAPLDRAAASPLYRQLAAQLLHQVQAGRLGAGQRLPSEAELMAAHGVSRVTVRQAIALLVRGGKLVTQRGKGTFVAGTVVRHELQAQRGFQESLRSQGIEPHTTLVEWSTEPGERKPSSPHGAQLPVYLRRLYAVDERPFAVVSAWLPAAAAQVGRARAARLNVYQILSQFIGAAVDHADISIRSERAPRDIGQLLALPKSSMVLVMERQSVDREGRALEFMRIHITPERYEFRLRVHGEVELARAVHAANPPQTREGVTA